jgi:hypothetical protein
MAKTFLRKLNLGIKAQAFRLKVYKINKAVPGLPLSMILKTALVLPLVTGCSNNSAVQNIKGKQAPAQMALNFQKAEDCDQASCITIQKTSLGKIFLLISSGVTGGSTPQWYDLKPQVVSFERSAQKIGLLGQNYNSIYDEIPSVNLIQTFQIINEDDKSITFDWGGGLKSFITQHAYDVDAARGMNNDLTETSYNSIPVVDSFIRKIKFDENNIELEQISKVPSALLKKGKDSLAVENREETIVMNIQIRAYNLDPQFKAKEFDASRRVGFFVSKLSRKNYSKDIKNLISKWDLSPSRGPIRVRLSATIPQEYIQAVSEAAFYWNKVFGRDIIKVETGVRPDEASPQDRSIMIRWINWLDAGAAYAISQSDPLSGEILRAQVFMPSVFTRVGSAALVHLNGKKPVVANGALACDFSKAFEDLSLLSREASNSQRLRLAQDNIRATVAHELGHALGLRHNFAGSFSAPVNLDEIEKSAKTYLQDLGHQGLETSTSIMDYVTGIDSILMAARIKYAPLSYDKMAMDWAYDKGSLSESVSKYCTDDDISLANSNGLSVYGCERFDAGKNPLQRKFQDAQNEKGNLVNVLFSSILGRMYPGDQPEVVNDLDQVLNETQKWRKADFSALTFVSKAVFDLQRNDLPTPSFASIENVKSGAILLSRRGIDTSWISRRGHDVNEAGGYAGMLNGLLRDSKGALDTHWFDLQVDAIEASEYIKKGRTLAGREYEFNPQEQAKIIQFFRKTAILNKKTSFYGLVELLPKINESEEQDDGKISINTAILIPGLLNQDQANSLSQLALDILVENSGQTAAVMNGLDGTLINLPLRFFENKERLLSLKLLSSKGLGFAMEMNKAKIKAQLMGLLGETFKKISDLDISGLSPLQIKTSIQDLYSKGILNLEAKNWFENELSIIEGLDN